MLNMHLLIKKFCFKALTLSFEYVTSGSTLPAGLIETKQRRVDANVAALLVNLVRVAGTHSRSQRNWKVKKSKVNNNRYMHFFKNIFNKNAYPNL